MNSKTGGTPTDTELGNILPPSAEDMSIGALAAKVMEDIQFLQDRIERVKNLQTPNAEVLKTYESMLQSRQQVLVWLQANGGMNQDVTSNTA